MSNENPRFGIRNVPPLATLAVGVAAILTLVIALFVLLGQGGSPTATQVPGGQPTGGQPTVLSTAAGQPTGGGVASPGTAAESTATLDITSGLEGVGSPWTLDGISGDVSPTATLIAAVWTETVDNVAEGYGDLITISMGGTIVEGTQATSEAGLGMGFAINRIDAAGNDLFNHVFSSKAGECQVTMARSATGVSGMFTCTGIKDTDGHTVNATGTFAT